MKANIRTKGFTIIEVVLVLAIAGLIFMMVFVALPSLQKAQRDTARKNDASTVAALVESYSSNNGGQLPIDGGPYNGLSTEPFAKYLTEILVKNTVKVITSASTGTDVSTSIAPSEDIIVVVKNSKCDTSASAKPERPIYNASNRLFTVITKLESGGGSYYCQNG